MSHYERAIIDFDRRCPGNDPWLVRLYVLLALTRGGETSLEDVHEAWAMWRTITRPEHPDLVPFEELTPETQEWDRPYMDAIHAVAAAVASS